MSNVVIYFIILVIASIQPPFITRKIELSFLDPSSVRMSYTTWHNAGCGFKHKIILKIIGLIA